MILVELLMPLKFMTLVAKNSQSMEKVESLLKS
jgi:hypothetical protein